MSWSELIDQIFMCYLQMLTQYSDGSFARDRLQWAKCVINYMVDAFRPNLTQLLVYLAEVLERCPPVLHHYILNLISLIITHGDFADVNPVPLNAQVRRFRFYRVRNA